MYNITIFYIYYLNNIFIRNLKSYTFKKSQLI